MAVYVHTLLQNDLPSERILFYTHRWLRWIYRRTARQHPPHRGTHHTSFLAQTQRDALAHSMTELGGGILLALYFLNSSKLYSMRFGCLHFGEYSIQYQIKRPSDMLYPSHCGRNRASHITFSSWLL